MYVLTDGWYADMTIKGVTNSEEEANEWSASGSERDSYGPFNPGEMP